MVIADVLLDLALPSLGRRRLAAEAVLVLAASVLIALTAQVSIPLPFSPVPITGQTFGVLLVGAALGARRGTLGVMAYLAEGTAGLPVFAGGSAGPAVLLGPTGGYLIGFAGAAFITGRLAELGWDRRPTTTALSMLLGNAVIYAFGLPWLAVYVGLDRVLALGLLPFVPGDLLKVGLAVAVLPGTWGLLGRFLPESSGLNRRNPGPV
jgi:biotin transport system substrate-specific component